MNYKLDIVRKTLTVTKKFEQNAGDPSTEEYQFLKTIERDFPDIVIVRKSRKTYSSKNRNRNMTYEKMEEYISAFDNSDVLLKNFYTIRELSAPQRNPYLYVKNWFVKQFPNYQKMPELSEEGLLIVNPIFAKYVKETKSEEIEAA